MGKSITLFLSWLLFNLCCFSQRDSYPMVKCDCSSKSVRDSLINKYLELGAEKYSYNSSKWQLYCDSLIALCPNIGIVYQHKAIPYIKMGDYAKAFSLEDKAVEKDPKAWTAYRGFLKCIFTKDYEGAIIDFQKAQQLTPNSTEMDHNYFFYEGLCNLELGYYAKAEENFKQDIFIQTGGDSNKENSLHFNTLLYTGIVYFEMKNYDKAQENLLKCLTMYKQLPEANFYLAMVYKNENNNELKNKYLLIAKDSKTKGYSMNEDNVFYAYYPHQITLYEINNELQQ